MLCSENVFGDWLFQERLAPMVIDALTENPISPDALMKIGIFGTITTGTGPTWKSIGAPSISPIWCE